MKFRKKNMIVLNLSLNMGRHIRHFLGLNVTEYKLISKVQTKSNIHEIVKLRQNVTFHETVELSLNSPKIE